LSALVTFEIIDIINSYPPALQDCLAMGAIFAATDSVATLQVLDRDAHPELFSLVFGEGVVNDAVSVVLLGAVAHAAAATGGRGGSFAGGIIGSFVYLFISSLVLGVAAGMGTAAALRAARSTRSSSTSSNGDGGGGSGIGTSSAGVSGSGPHQELATIALLSYATYLLADVAGLSAILALFACGVTLSHVALPEVSAEGRAATLTTFKTASNLAEGIIFVYLGLDALDPLKWKVRQQGGVGVHCGKPKPKPKIGKGIKPTP
jgi:NhaP-type Na+/H+ or K+/H+ antiporter